MTQYATWAIQYIRDCLVLSAREALILLYLASEADENGRAKADTSRLAAQVGCAYRTLKSILQTLHEDGLLRRVRADGSVSESGEFYQLSLGIEQMYLEEEEEEESCRSEEHTCQF